MKICYFSNKRNIIGNKISKSKNKNKRKFKVNFKKKIKIFSKIKNKWIKINISCSGFRTLKKKNINYE
ncbi:MAG: L28 family ribosomal protein [Candidatus Shikimatogenerans sp. AspAUS03]|uniref:L28 family ribosomal protein n=1 Tax=Candidatus Shikimatogenerans sp. AspAUS03 TaxID=3158563 RepID=A0AAU7QS39_9FLAO